jgi:hypothetical protein
LADAWSAFFTGFHAVVVRLVGVEQAHVALPLRHAALHRLLVLDPLPHQRLILRGLHPRVVEFVERLVGEGRLGALDHAVARRLALLPGGRGALVVGLHLAELGHA